MAFAGLKKQFNKANQFISEKTGAAEGTKFSDEYMVMEKKTDLTNELVEELLGRTKEFLQPNPASRAKLMISSRVGQTKAHAYPQPEGTLGEIMVKYGSRLGECDSHFAQSLMEMGEAMKQMAEVKYALEDNVKQNFLEPLHHLQAKDLRDVMHHRKKLEGRRLDYDCKKRKKVKGGHVTEEEIRAAEEKFEESYNLAASGMHNLLASDVEQISQLAALSEALYEYYSQCSNILESLTARLIELKNEAAQVEPEPYVPKRLHELTIPIGHDDLSPGQHDYNVPSPARSPATTPTHSRQIDSLFVQANNQANNTSTTPSRSPNASALPSPVQSPAPSPVTRGPCCQALYDFEPENPQELGFKEGEIITLTNKIDENWFEGTVNGKTGIFPSNYVQVLVPIGQR